MFDSALASPAAILDSPGEKAAFWTVGIFLFAFFLFFFSIQPAQNDFDYTARMASALLQGDLGWSEPLPSWLNEAVPKDGRYYTVFPLGAVLTLMPVAALRETGLIKSFPGRAVAAVVAGACVVVFFQLANLEGVSLGRRILLGLLPVFGTWTWCNLGFAGAWQLTLGFALLGQAAALYFILVKRRPLLAGAFFALAFGNRTELLLVAPIFLYLLLRADAGTGSLRVAQVPRALREHWRSLTWFLLAPAVLAICTAAYNFARFDSIFDFGHARIPGLFEEPWYQHGLFSLHAIPWNMQSMLFAGMRSASVFPYLLPDPFACSIFLSSPFLFLLFREGGKYRAICWIAIALLTFFLWCHGNPGGWQFSYRYAMILLPWMFLLLLGNGAKKTSATELSLFAVSIAINAMATYQFLWTDQINP